ncbi:MAG: UDP-N-acetyl-L-fucosamine synthase [Rikenellaceae bacterium]|nr:UDP-N-acetyl-L-fucosamine synthase [Rikenellaceae bacterium]MDN5355125.1 UDP-N-acetyl-L-fucosamine synthase [Rikenellaceae bacterium]
MNSSPITHHLSPKILTFLGTRPEIIRLSRVMPLLDQYTNHIIVHTGQNYDYELNEIFWEELELRKPDYFLDADTSSLGATIGDIFRKSEEVLKKEMPDAVLVLGDTNSCLAAYMAKRMHIPIYHMEAGNRCFDQNVPEETNRKIIDHIADFNLVYTEHARRHLLSEGLPHRRIYLTGSPMREVLDYYLPKIEKSGILEKSNLEKNNYFVVSIHREENVDNQENLEQILKTLNQIAETYQLPIIISTHPRTRKRLESLHSSLITHNSLLHFHKPFGFIDYVQLQKNAKCVLSDSGTISEESAILNFPAITIRNSMERPEAIDAGTIILTGFDHKTIMNSIEFTIDEFAKRKTKNIPDEYKISDTSWRVLKIIIGTAKLSNKWWGIK